MSNVRFQLTMACDLDVGRWTTLHSWTLDIGLWTVGWYIAERNGPQFRIESWERSATLPSLLN